MQTKADIDQSVALVKSAQLDVHHATVFAPHDGVVANKLVTVGQYVKAGTQLMTLVPTKSMYVVANFKETQIAKLRKGQAVRIIVDADQGRSYFGSVDSLAPATGSEFSLLPPENATGNFTKIVQRVPVKILLTKESANSNGAISTILRPGLSVTVEVDTKDSGAHSNQKLSSSNTQQLGASSFFSSSWW
ncbi:MAG: HlyD family secretion protein [Burkholderiaceae bacterium]|nr:MAG: HlyD family secretion protein [Burkholderiaceae bacterium]